MFKPNFLIILLIAFVDHMGIGLVYPIFTTLLFDTNSSILPVDASASLRGAMLGLLMALTPLAQFFSSSLLGAFSDRKGRRLALTIGLTVGVIGYLIAVLGIWTESLLLLLLYRTAVGLSDSTVAVCQASIADISDEGIRPKRFAIFASSLGLGFTVGPFVGGIMAETLGYVTPFIAAGSLSLLNLILVSFFFPETRKVVKAESETPPYRFWESLQSLQKVFFWPHLRYYFIGGFALNFGWAFFNEFFPILLRSQFSFSLTEIGYYFAVGGIWFALSSSIGTTYLLKKFTPKLLVIMALIGCSLFMLLHLLLVEGIYIWWILPPLMFFLAIAFPTSSAIVSNEVDDSQQGEVLGVYQSIQSAAMGLSPLFVGFIVGPFPALAPLGGGLTMALACLAFWYATRRIPVEETT